MNGADQERREELAALYALGIGSASEHGDLQNELRATPELSETVKGLSRTVVGLAQSVPLVDPPIALRARVLTSVTGKRFGPVAMAGAGAGTGAEAGSIQPAAPKTTPTETRSTTGVRDIPVTRPRSKAWQGWLAAAAALFLAAWAGTYALEQRNRVAYVEAQLADATSRANRAEEDLVTIRRTLGDAEAQTRTLRLQAAVLMAPDMNKVDLAGQPVAPSAAARAFWSRSQGVVFAATKLPALPAGKTYQLWLVPASGAPLSAGLIAPDAHGNATVHFATPPGTPDKVAALAVTLEPEGGVPAPTGDKYLVGLSSF
jgi:anti-sigma-K factor RskA